jgi:hypothetical protein
MVLLIKYCARNVPKPKCAPSPRRGENENVNDHSGAANRVQSDPGEVAPPPPFPPPLPPPSPSNPQVAPSIPQLPPSRPVAPSPPKASPISSGFSVLFCRLYFAATSGVCLIRSLRRRWFFKRNYIRKKSDWKFYVYKIKKSIPNDYIRSLMVHVERRSVWNCHYLFLPGN